jgi:DNA-binding NtrC family response regulator
MALNVGSASHRGILRCRTSEGFFHPQLRGGIWAAPVGAMTRILVIDDDATIRGVIERVLKRAGYEVVMAVNGEDGLEQHRTNPANLIITDLFMPQREGLETIIQLRREFPAVPVVAISGEKSTSSNMLTAAAKLGAAKVLEKPFDSKTLLGVVQDALARCASKPAAA